MKIHEYKKFEKIKFMNVRKHKNSHMSILQHSLK